MEVRYLPNAVHYKKCDTKEIRENFLIENLFTPGNITMIYSDMDRAIVGSAVPTSAPVKLEAGAELASEYFAQRREIGVINIGGLGKIKVDDSEYTLANCDSLYIGRGSRDIEFSSTVKNTPAKYYFLSYPAHKEYPTACAALAEAAKVDLGSDAESNRRSIHKIIHPGGIKSCQLVMGMTALEEGSVWNTMAAHTHERRTEIYMYFDLPENSLLFHIMGPPEETRHIVVRDEQAVLSPGWSIHSGAGTRNYKFIWAMGGENQAFDDMDSVEMDNLL